MSFLSKLKLHFKVTCLIVHFFFPQFDLPFALEDSVLKSDYKEEEQGCSSSSLYWKMLEKDHKWKYCTFLRKMS